MIIALIRRNSSSCLLLLFFPGLWCRVCRSQVQRLVVILQNTFLALAFMCHQYLHLITSSLGCEAAATHEGERLEEGLGGMSSPLIKIKHLPPTAPDCGGLRAAPPRVESLGRTQDLNLLHERIHPQQYQWCLLLHSKAMFMFHQCYGLLSFSRPQWELGLGVLMNVKPPWKLQWLFKPFCLLLWFSTASCYKGEEMVWDLTCPLLSRGRRC